MQIRFNQGQFTVNRYAQTNSELNKTLKKLSSGYRINDAADDAAGLSISEKMRAQINGLNQASENIQDGISLINVADGGLGQIQSPNLVRMRELIIQAANDTNSIEDRQKIQQEIDQIKQGINDIAESSEFNTIPVLTPTDLKPVPNAAPKFDIIFLIDDSGSMGQSIKMVKAGLSTFSEKMKTWGDAAFGSTSVATPFTDGSRNLNLTSDINVLENHLENVHQAQGGTTQTEKILSNLLDSTSALGGRSDAQKVYIIVTDTGTEDTASDLNNTDLKSKVDAQNAQVYTIGVGGYRNENFFQDRYGEFSTGVFVANSASEISENLTPNLADEIANNSGNSQRLQKDLLLQIGANSGQTITIPLFDNRSEAIGINSINVVDSYENAMEALNRVDIATGIISERRSMYGALYNRLEHANNNVQNAAELLTKAESSLRDVDIAKEVTKLNKDQILLQSSQAMMAQVNQMSQGILQLLK